MILIFEGIRDFGYLRVNKLENVEPDKCQVVSTG
jgi:hypothetical protein